MGKKDSILWTCTEAATYTGGKNTQAWVAGGVAINIDEIRHGDVFIAAKEDDLCRVLEKGAAAAIVAGTPECDYGLPVLKVGDVFEALQALAIAARYRTHATIISVQGKAARQIIQNLLHRAGTIHEGGRHLSLGLANLPEDVDYGLFGSSPIVQPDITIITNCENARHETVIETMPTAGTVIINADDENFLTIVARAKAAGIQNIYTYGRHASADARLYEFVKAGNGSRLSVRIAGQEFSVVMPPKFEFNSVLLAGLLTLKLTDRALLPAIRALAATAQPAIYESGYDPSGISLIDPALQKNEGYGPQAVFRITNMIDLGFGRQTAVLDNLTHKARNALTLPKKDLAIPRKLASLDFVYTSKGFGAVANAHEVIREKHGNARLEPIIPDVLAPGDFLVFKGIWDNSRAIVSEALRMTPQTGKRKVRV